MAEPWHTILSIIGLVGGLLAFFLAVLGKMLEKRLADLEKSRDRLIERTDELTDRLHKDEVDTTKLRGELDVMHERIAGISAPLVERMRSIESRQDETNHLLRAIYERQLGRSYTPPNSEGQRK